VIRAAVSSFYDREDDVLVITIGGPAEAITESVSNTFFLRVDPDTLKLVGIEVSVVKTLIARQPEFLDLFADATGVPGPSVPDSLHSSSSDATGRLVHIVRDLVST
jgi:hypothetical protein